MSDLYLRDDFVRLSEADSPELHKAVNRLAKNAGLDSIELYAPNPSRYSVSTRVNMFRKNCAALTVGPKRIIVGDRLLELMTGDRSGHKMSQEMEAILAHEIGHLKNDHGLYNIGKIVGASYLGAFAAAFAGLMAINYAHQHFESKNEDASEESQAKQAYGSILLPQKEQERSLSEKLLTNALALGGAGLVLRKINYAKEFRADRVSAELLKDGRPLANALKKLIDDGHQMQKAIEKELHSSGSKEQADAFEYLKNATSEIVGAIQRMIGTHPDISKRIDRLEAMRF